MSNVQYNEVIAEEDGQRLDNYLIRVLKGVPKSFIYRIIRAGEVRINKKRAKPSSRIYCGDSIRIPPVRRTAESTITVHQGLAEHLQASILYEDEGLLVINKPSGIAVHGGSGLSLGIIEALRKIRVDLSYLELVHRLDKDTSGCLLIAKKRSVLRTIQALFADRTVKKTYWLIAEHAWLGKKEVVVNAPLEKNLLKSGERFVTINERGKPSKTYFKLIENFEKACWIEAKPETGRTHQIRVHAVFLKHPIIGDLKYGDPEALDKGRLYLHAQSIEFNLNDKPMRFEAEYDDKFKQLLKQLQKTSKEPS